MSSKFHRSNLIKLDTKKSSVYFRDYRPSHTSLDLTGTCQSVTHVADALTVSQVHRLKKRNVELETGTAQEIAIVKTQLQEFELPLKNLEK